MDGYVGWVALIGAAGTCVAVVTFWMNLAAKLQDAQNASAAAKEEAKSAKEDLKNLKTALDAQNMRFGLIEHEIGVVKLDVANRFADFAEKYASHQDVIAVEARVASALNGLKDELRGMNTRFDRIMEMLVNGRKEA